MAYDFNTALDVILAREDPEDWFESGAVEILAHFRGDLVTWGEIKARAKKRGVSAFDLEKAVDQWRVISTNGRGHEDLRTPVVDTFSEVEKMMIEWLWWPYLAKGTLAMLDGDPGIGKSLLTLHLAAALSRGFPLPDQQGVPTVPTGEPSNSLFLALEDSLGAVMKPRLEASGADCARICVLQGWKDAENEAHLFTLADMDVFRQALDTYRPALVVIDPIQAYLGARVNMNQANETRPLLTKLAQEAERSHCCIVCVRHAAKGSSESGIRAMMRGLGSIDFVGTARTALYIEQHPLNPTGGLLCQTKNNQDIIGRTQQFSKAEGRFQWAGITRVDAETIAGSGRGPFPRALLEACFHLEQLLSNGIPWSAEDIQYQLEQEGCKKDSIKHAKKVLGVKSRRIEAGTWEWQLPPLDLISIPTPIPATHSRDSNHTTSTTNN